MKTLIKFIIVFSFIITYQNSYSKPIPPGSGAGDVPANILFLLDTSASMNEEISASGTSVGQTNDLVELSDGYLIIAEKGGGIIKMSIADGIKDGSFAGGTGKFLGAEFDPNCTEDSQVRNISFLEVSKKVKGESGDVIFALDTRSNKEKIVMFNSSGVCIDVIFPTELNTGGKDFEPRAMEMRTIDSEDHLFVAGRQRKGSNKKGYLYTKNLTTGSEKTCFYNSMPTGSNYLNGKMKHVNDIAVDDGNNIFISHQGNIYKYALTEDDDGNYCAGAEDAGTKDEEANVKYEQASDCTDSDKHCFAFYIDIDPNDPSIMYMTSGGRHVVQKLKITDTTIEPTLADIWKGLHNNIPTLSDEKVHFHYPRGIHVSSSKVWIMDAKPSIQYFEKDANLTWVANFGQMLRRVDGAIRAIKAVVSDSSFTSGANFGYGYWNSGEGDNSKKVDNRHDPEFTNAGYYCHGPESWGNQNCEYYGIWSGSHPNGTSLQCNINSCLNVAIHKEGHNKIVAAIDETELGWGTDANSFSKMAYQYFSDPSVEVIDPEAADCQLNYVIVISDGAWMNQAPAEARIADLRRNYNVKTLAVAYGGGINDNTKDNLFKPMAIAGSCDDLTGAAKECEPFIDAETPEALKTQLASKVSSIIADKLSFTAPSITATIQEGGSLYQAQFNYVQHGEWSGTILRKTLNTDGSVNHDISAPGNWNAAEMIKAQPSRRIWTVLPEVNYIGEWDNFKAENSTYINELFIRTGNTVLDYHNTSSTCGGEDDIYDDIDGLINFVRGYDYFAYNGCENIDNLRDHVLGDIYNSQLVEVGPPNANYSFTNPNEEAFWRVKNNYQSFTRANENRKSIIYAGANDGMLHAINAETGQEEWGFVPPFIAAKLPTIINVGLDGKVDSGNGGSNAIFGVDGSPVVHDMFIKGLNISGAKESSPSWHTILIVPYGRGGSGFSVLDITYPIIPGVQGPLHMFSIFNDAIKSEVLVADKDGNITEYPYTSQKFKLAQSKEARKAEKNERKDFPVATCQSNVDALPGKFYEDGENSCYKGNTFTFDFTAPSTDENKYNIYRTNDDGSRTTIAPHSVTALGGYTEIKFNTIETYNASQSGDSTEVSSRITIELADDITGVQKYDYKYDYSQLGETWSTPRVFRMPLRSDTEYFEDKYVAVMGGGHGSSKLFIINLEDDEFPGSIAGSKENKGPISIVDSDSSNIANALSNTVVAITPDSASGIPWRGAMIYVNDLEGKITKFNLTNSTKNGAELYEQTTLFKLNSSTDNGRYSYFSLDATIGRDSKAFWLFGGTGDFQRVNDVDGSMDNILYGIKDHDYPYFKSNLKVPRQDTDGWKTVAVQNINLAHDVDDPDICVNTTLDDTGELCPVASDDGWVVHLDDLANNKYKKLTGTPTVFKGRVYFPMYKPPDGGNRCSLGTAYICSADDECGTNKSFELAEAEGATDDEDPCYFVRAGILSELVVFGDTLYGNVAGPSDTEETLVSILAGSGEVSSYRKSWRQNY